MVLVCHVILQDYVIKGLLTLWKEAPHGKSPTCQVFALDTAVVEI